MNQPNDEFDRACDAAGVKRDSELARLLRQNAFFVAGIDFADTAGRDQKLTKFLADRRVDFPQSLVEPIKEPTGSKHRPGHIGREKVEKVGQLSQDEFRAIARGEMTVE